MPQPPPELDIQAVLRTHWEDDATGLADPPGIHTGKYTRGDVAVPAVTITDGSEGPIGGGETGYTALDGAGRGGVQRIGGALTVDCVAGSYDDLRGAGAGGANLNPKQVRWDLYEHAAQLLVDHQLDPETDLLWISPGEGERLAQAFGSESDVEYVFSIQFRAGYGYDRRPR